MLHTVQLSAFQLLGAWQQKEQFLQKQCFKSLIASIKHFYSNRHIIGERNSGTTSVNPGNTFNWGAASGRLLCKVASQGRSMPLSLVPRASRLPFLWSVGKCPPFPTCPRTCWVTWSRTTLLSGGLLVGIVSDMSDHLAVGSCIHPTRNSWARESCVLIYKPHHTESLVLWKIQILVKIVDCRVLFSKHLWYVPMSTVTFCEFLTMFSDLYRIRTIVLIFFFFSLGNLFRKRSVFENCS